MNDIRKDKQSLKYKLIASDIDGTLVNDKLEITERTKEAIKNAIDAGAIFVTATGRAFQNTKIVGDLLDKDMPFIVFNGAAAFMGKSEKLLFERFLDYDLAKEAFIYGQKIEIPQIVWAGPRLLASGEYKETLRYQTLSRGLEMTVINDLAEIIDEVKGISKVLWIDDPVRIKKLAPKMREHFKGRLKCVSSMAHYLEFVSNDAGKGTALADIGKLFGIDKSEMIAIGDGNNDIGMITYAGLGVAVENAPDDVRAAADYITLSNNENGVAHVIEKFILST